MTVEELSSRVAEVSVGMGSVRLNGDVTERLDGECSMGELKLTLAGMQTDFNYDLSCGMGELKVGDDSYNGLAQEKQINNNASKIWRWNVPWAALWWSLNKILPDRVTFISRQ